MKQIILTILIFSSVLFVAAQQQKNSIAINSTNSYYVSNKSPLRPSPFIRPFTNATAPIELIATGKPIPGWTVDQHGLCAVLPQSPVTVRGPSQQLTVPMGGARLRISSFPVVK